MTRGIATWVFRTIVASTFIALTAALPARGQMAAPTAKNFWVFVGTYSTTGIQLFKLDTQAGTLTKVGQAGAGDNPNFVVIAPNQKYLYAGGIMRDSNNRPIDSVLAYSIDAATGKLTSIGGQPSLGEDTCWVTVDPSGKNVLAASYGNERLNTATIDVFPIQADGKIGPAQSVIHEVGSGAVKGRQDESHSHSINVTPDGKIAMCCNLGADKIFLYHFDADKGTLTPNDPAFIQLPPGTGPRHLTFDQTGKIVYVVTELSAKVISFQYDSDHGTFTQIESVSTTKPNQQGENAPAEVQIDPSGKFLYASNRLDTNYLTIFSIDKPTAKLTLVGYQDSMGKNPRNFRIDPTGNFLIVVNQDGNNLAMFKIDQATGKLTQQGPLFTGLQHPVCVKFLAIP